MFRELKANEIDVRTQSIKEKGAVLLLYKDARCDMNILDEEVGPMNWQRSHSRDNANCTVSIYDESKGIWVSKEDTGTESNTEKEKGLASDSFKRACFNWGIGRELYTAPFIWVNGTADELKKATYKCKEIGYDSNGEIDKLVIVNTKTNKTVFTFGSNVASQTKPKEETKSDKGFQQQVTSKFNELVTKHGTNETVYELIGITREKFIEDYKTNPEMLLELLNGY